MFRSRFLLLVPLLLAGCDVPTPLPLTPVQVIQGAWPPKTPPAAVAAQRNYTITGNTFAFPALGFSIGRPDANDWQFVPGNNAVSVETRDNSGGVRPALTINFVALPAGTDVPTQIQADEQNLQQGGATLGANATRTVSGVSGTDVTYTQSDPQSGLATKNERIYLTVDNTIVLVQVQAASSDFDALKPDFDQIIASIVLPGVSAQASGTDTASQTASASGT
ncbi:MAG TPA: hypothetical protein V6D47_22295 [Oscillatoriaceae cyanobacterium]